MRSLLLSLLMIFSTIAFGAEYSTLEGKLILGRCHMDMCWWFSIENAAKMGESKAWFTPRPELRKGALNRGLAGV